MSGYETRPHNQDVQDAVRTEGWRWVAWLRKSASGLLDRLTSRSSHREGGSGPGFFRRKGWWIAAAVVLLAVPIAGMITGYMTKPASGPDGRPGKSNFETFSDGTIKPKPAPGRPLLSSTQSPPPQIQAPAGPAAIAPLAPGPQSLPLAPRSVPPPAPNTYTAPPAPVAKPNLPYAPVTYPARHEKHFGESCSGQLTLNGGGLMFNCSDNTRDTFQVAMNQIASLDENGIRLTSGKKYHFAIAGMTKSDEERVFTDWWNRVR